MEEQAKSAAEQCAEEVTEILKKYNCRIIVEQRDYFGQIVYAPVFVEVKNQKQ